MDSLSSSAMFTLSFLVIIGVNVVCGEWSVTARISESVELGESATVQCNYQNTDEKVVLDSLEVLGLRGNKSEIYMQYDLGSGLLIINSANRTNNRYIYNVATQTMTLTSVKCEDEQKFTCRLKVRIINNGDSKKESFGSLYVKVKPSAPDPMTTAPANLTSGVNEGDTVTATCYANVGRPKKGRIQWRIYRDSREERVADDDNRIAVSQSSPNEKDVPCTERYRSTLSIRNVTEYDQNLVLTCFVNNTDFPTYAEKENLYQQSETIRVHYSVRRVQVSKGSDGDIYEGSSLILKCIASGFPAPTYRWTKVGDNQTLTTAMSGGYSQLVLTNVKIDQDSGDYRCTAFNLVNAVTMSDTDQIRVQVVTPPSTTTPDPSPSTDDIPTPTNSPSGDDDDGDDYIIIVVVIVVVVAVVITVIVAVCVWRQRKSAKDGGPARGKEIPYYNNRQTLGGLGGPTDVLGDDKKKPIGGSLNCSFDTKYDDGLRDADLIYDNQPRSRKPITQSSEYAEVQMPQV